MKPKSNAVKKSNEDRRKFSNGSIKKSSNRRVKILKKSNSLEISDDS